MSNTEGSAPAGADQAKSGVAGFFVTGTDTGVGKTRVSCALLRALGRSGVKAIGMKPVASGCEWKDGKLRNDDALALLEHGEQAPYELVNPFAYGPPIAPHLAARAANRPVSLEHIDECYRVLRAQAESVVVEGAGGFLVPLDEKWTLAEIPRRYQLGVILVVGIRLGCINHALLTERALLADGLPFVGWVANRIDPVDLNNQDQIDALRARLTAPLLGSLPHQQEENVQAHADLLDVSPLLRALNRS